MSDVNLGTAIVSTAVDSSGVDAGVNASVTKIKKIGEATAEVSKQASESLGGIGDSGETAAKKADGAVRRAVTSIQREIARISTEGQGSAARFEALFKIRGLDSNALKPYLDKLREAETEANRLAVANRAIGTSAVQAGSAAANQVRNASYQITDFITQVQGGQRVTLALSQQLPQLLAGFGAAGAGLGVVAALIPSVFAAFSTGATESKKLDGALGDLNSAIGEVGKTAADFNMDKVYEEFNKANASTRAAIIEQLNFQREYIRTTQIVSEKSFGKALDNISLYGASFDSMLGGVAIEEFAKKLSLPVEVSKQLIPSLQGLKSGTESFQQAFNKFGTSLLSGNEESVKLAVSLRDMAKAEKEVTDAQNKLFDAQGKMAKAGDSKKIEIGVEKQKQVRKETEQASEAAKAYASVMESLSKSIGESESAQLGLTGVTKAFYDVIRTPEFQNMPDTWKQTAVAQFEQAKAAEDAANTLKRLNTLLDATPTAKLEAARADMMLLAKAFEDGKISAEQFNEAAIARLDQSSQKAKEASDVLSQYARTAAQNAQTALADFLFDPFAKGVDGMAKSFAQTIQRMVANAAAAQIAQNLFGNMGQTTNGQSGNWGWVGQALSWASSFENGGVMTDKGPLPLRAYSNGGVANSPQVALYGEGRNPEAYVPLPDGRNIPVKMQGNSGGGTTVIHVNVQSGTASEVRRAAGAGAREALSIMNGAQRYA